MDYQRELLGGSSFLDRYEEQLSSLCRNQRFINMISLASKEAAEKTGSDTGKAGKNIISDTLFRERAYLLLPGVRPYRRRCCAKRLFEKVCRSLDLLRCQNSECFLLLRKLFGVTGERIGSLPARLSCSEFIECEHSTNLGGDSFHHRQVSQRRRPRTRISDRNGERLREIGVVPKAWRGDRPIHYPRRLSPFSAPRSHHRQRRHADLCRRAQKAVIWSNPAKRRSTVLLHAPPQAQCGPADLRRRPTLL